MIIITVKIKIAMIKLVIDNYNNNNNNNNNFTTTTTTINNGNNNTEDYKPPPPTTDYNNLDPIYTGLVTMVQVLYIGNMLS